MTVPWYTSPVSADDRPIRTLPAGSMLLAMSGFQITVKNTTSDDMVFKLTNGGRFILPPGESEDFALDPAYASERALAPDIKDVTPS